MKKMLIAAGGSLVLLLGACSKDADTSDFKSQTEKFLKDDDKVVEQIGQEFTDASCERPTSKAVDTTYTCTATAADSTEWTFKVQITSKNGFTVVSGSPTDAAAPAAGATTPAGETTETTAG